jgi:hypothetical protein
MFNNSFGGDWGAGEGSTHLPRNWNATKVKNKLL